MSITAAQFAILGAAAFALTGLLTWPVRALAIRLGAMECYINGESIWVTGGKGGHARAGWPEE